MSRRIEVELTSSRGDGSWTWRAAGAKQPKGDVAGELLYDGAKVGDVVRAEAEFLLDGIEIVSITAPKAARSQPELLEIVGSGRHDGGVTTSLVEKKGRGRGDRDRDGDRKGRKPRGEGSNRTDRPQRQDRTDRSRRPQRDEPARPARPKPKRLRPGRTHRTAALAALPEEKRPIAEIVLKDGLAGVRQALDAQNATARAAGQPEIPADGLLAVAEGIVPVLREAEWRDRAEAALAGVDEIDLRDLRSVVVAGQANAGRAEEARALADQLSQALSTRVDNEHAKWQAELAEAISEGRTVGALRLSSRPPKAGSPLPSDMAERLSASAAEAMTADISQNRWATLLDAVAYSPVRQSVTPAGIPAKPNSELLGAVTKLSSRVPEIAALFGIEPSKPPRGGRTRKKPPPKPSPAAAADPVPADPVPADPVPADPVPADPAANEVTTAENP